MTRPRVLVIGSRGQLARALAAVGTADCTLRFAGRPEVDLAHPDSVTGLVWNWRPDVIVNAAGITQASAAKASPADMLTVNALGAGRLAEAGARSGAALIQISTADVFAGAPPGIYAEHAPTAPRGFVAASKFLGEETVMARCRRVVVLRTGWLFSPWGEVATTPGAEQPVSVCSALDLARICLWIAPVIADAPAASPFWGITHCAGRGACRTGDLAAALAGRGFAPVARSRIGAQGPGARVLDCARLTRVFGHRLPHWEESLREVLALAPGVDRAVPA